MYDACHIAPELGVGRDAPGGLRRAVLVPLEVAFVYDFIEVKADFQRAAAGRQEPESAGDLFAHMIFKVQCFAGLKQGAVEHSMADGRAGPLPRVAVALVLQHREIVTLAHHDTVAGAVNRVGTTLIERYAGGAIRGGFAAPQQHIIAIVHRDIGARHRFAVVKAGDPDQRAAERAGAQADVEIGDLHQSRALCGRALGFAARGTEGGAIDFNQPQPRFVERQAVKRHRAAVGFQRQVNGRGQARGLLREDGVGYAAILLRPFPWRAQHRQRGYFRALALRAADAHAFRGESPFGITCRDHQPRGRAVFRCAREHGAVIVGEPDVRRQLGDADGLGKVARVGKRAAIGITHGIAERNGDLAGFVENIQRFGSHVRLRRILVNRTQGDALSAVGSDGNFVKFRRCYRRAELEIKSVARITAGIAVQHAAGHIEREHGAHRVIKNLLRFAGDAA